MVSAVSAVSGECGECGERGDALKAGQVRLLGDGEQGLFPGAGCET